MSTTRDIFEERRNEIAAYFDFVTHIIDDGASLIFPLPLGSTPEAQRREESIDLSLSHTLKANGFLLLYNLVEATMSTAIEEIHETICNIPALGADELNETLSKKAMKRFRSGAMEITQHCGSPISQSILRYWLDEHKKGVGDDHNPLFSGNVDAMKIRAVADDYGFSHKTNGRKTKAGKRLLDVKSKRNELAHGRIAFKECGQNMSLTELLEIKMEVIHYLDEILSNIETYMNAQNFLRNPPLASPTTTAILSQYAP